MRNKTSKKEVERIRLGMGRSGEGREKMRGMEEGREGGMERDS